MDTIYHDQENCCFRTPDGAVLSYTVKDGRYLLDHTEVPEALRGQGIAAKLARVALDHARDENWKIVPACSFIERYIQRYPEYAGLVVDGY